MKWQELLSKNANRKREAVEAAALDASQRGLLGAITLVVSKTPSVREAPACRSTVPKEKWKEMCFVFSPSPTKNGENELFLLFVFKSQGFL